MAREAARGLRVASFHLLRSLNSFADEAANKAMDDKADSELFSAAGRALLVSFPDAAEGVGCPRPKPPAPWIHPEKGGEGRLAVKDPGAGPFPSADFGPVLACDCSSPLPGSALICGKFCHVSGAEAGEAPAVGLLVLRQPPRGRSRPRPRPGRWPPAPSASLPSAPFTALIRIWGATSGRVWVSR